MIIFSRKLGRSLDCGSRLFSSSVQNDFSPRVCEWKNPQKNQFITLEDQKSSLCTEAIDAYFATWKDFSYSLPDKRSIIAETTKESSKKLSLVKSLKKKGIIEAVQPKLKTQDELNINPCGIQMLSDSIHQQIFKDSADRNQHSEETLVKVEAHLKSHNLWGRSAPLLSNVNLTLPPLDGDSLSEHFQNIAEKQCEPYRKYVLAFITHEIPEMPEEWNFAAGWTCYSEGGQMKQVDYPNENAYVFDVEVCVKEGHLPTIATAVSTQHWYSWCSPQLFEQKVNIVKQFYRFHVLIFSLTLDHKKCFEWLGSSVHTQ